MSQFGNPGGNNLTTSDSSVTGDTRKVCCECGIDVTGRKRMKDSQGRYWCYECGTADQMRKGNALSGSVCPDCMQTFPPVKLMKHDNKYVCPECYESRVRRERERSNSFMGKLGAIMGGKQHLDEGAAAEAARQRKLLIGLVITAIATVIYYAFFN